MRKKKAVFEAAPGAMFNNVQAQVIGEYLFELAGVKMGTLTAREVLDFARPQNSPIHNYFNWDDSMAAECWRVQQARLVINHLVLVRIVDGREKSIKAFFNVGIPEEDSEEERRVYVTSEVVAHSEYFRQQVIERALGELKAWQIRYREYKELAIIFGAIKEVQQSFKHQEEVRPEA